MNFRSFWAELKRRNVYRVAVAPAAMASLSPEREARLVESARLVQGSQPTAKTSARMHGLTAFSD